MGEKHFLELFLHDLKRVCDYFCAFSKQAQGGQMEKCFVCANLSDLGGPCTFPFFGVLI